MTMPSRCPDCSSASGRARRKAPTRTSSRASTTPGSMRRVRSPTRRWSGSAKPASMPPAMLAHRFAVVTTLSRSVPVLENNLLRYGLDRRCARVRATDVPVLELDNPASNARAKIGGRNRARARRGSAPRRSCSAAPAWRILRPRSSAEFGVPVIDGVAAAVVMAEGLAAIGLRTSKRGGFARPLAKTYSGQFAPFSPKA